MEYVYLQGSEDVQRAGQAMRSSAETIQSASNNLSSAFYEHGRFMTEWLDRLEMILKENKE